jgi:hypothetical protein
MILTGKNIGSRWVKYKYGALVEWYWQTKTLVVDEWNISMEHWWNDTDRQKPRYSGKNLSQCHLVHHQFLGLNVNLYDDRPLANYLNHGTDVFCYMDCFCSHVANNSHWTANRLSSGAVKRLSPLLVSSKGFHLLLFRVCVNPLIPELNSLGHWKRWEFK